MIKKEITYGEKPYIAYDDIIGGRQDFTEPVHYG